MSDKNISKAIASIEADVESGVPDPNMSLAEKFDVLYQEVIENSYNIFMKAGKKGYRISDDEQYMQDTRIKQLNIIAGVFSKLKRLGRISDQPNENFEKQLLQKIKSKRSSVGDIVANIEQPK